MQFLSGGSIVSVLADTPVVSGTVTPLMRTIHFRKNEICTLYGSTLKNILSKN